ncbi:response regulator transcription factor [Polynucleobacter alcilacus]|uniref:response regulator transcription factor n=1 Tax=Polynucleobacter alcilacus TaxID=1819739 RepID=UPI001C0C8962|nr:response regulator transcription factor [Polynucleobacter alcilacus]MBU3566588.1 response regulator transcription factor [Polynucleobacter alcilacus]
MSIDTKTPIKVQIVDPHQIALWGMKQLISSNAKYSVCATSTNVKEAIASALASEPDVIVLEPDLDGEDGIELITTLLQKTNAKIIIFTGNNKPNLHDQAVVKGARGVITKNESNDILLKAIEKIHLGELWINRNATSRILMQIAEANAPKVLSNEQKKLGTLSTKEEKVTRAIQMHSEKTLKEIASTLNISEHTLRNHLASIYSKLDLRNRLELYVFCGKYQKTNDPSVHPRRRSTDG